MVRGVIGGVSINQSISKGPHKATHGQGEGEATSQHNQNLAPRSATGLGACRDQEQETRELRHTEVGGVKCAGVSAKRRDEGDAALLGGGSARLRPFGAPAPTAAAARSQQQQSCRECFGIGCSGLGAGWRARDLSGRLKRQPWGRGCGDSVTPE